MPRSKTHRTYNEQMLTIVQRYQGDGERWPAPARDIAAWATRKRLWEPRKSAVVDQCADHLSRAMREEYITDPQGRRVRAKHAARFMQGEKQITFWATSALPAASTWMLHSSNAANRSWGAVAN